MSLYAVDKLISEARRLAAEYRRTTGKILPLSIELAENDAARLMSLDLLENKAGGYDAIGRGSREGKRIQIKGRVLLDGKKSPHRIGQLKVDQEWDSVMLVLMDENFEPIEIYEAQREKIMEALDEAKNSKRSKRGAMSVARFKMISELVWSSNESNDGEVS